MTIKSFAFENPIDLETQARNWRQFDQNSKFVKFTPTLSDFTNTGTPEGFCFLYGPLVYYYIYIPWNDVAPGITVGANPKVRGLPYGPESPSGSKTSTYPQYLDCIASAQEVSSGFRAQIRSLAGTLEILVPTYGGGKGPIAIYGWVFRDA